MEPPLAQCSGRAAKGQHLGVGGRVAGGLSFVVGAGHDLTVDQHNRTDWNLSRLAGDDRLGQRLVHRPIEGLVPGLSRGHGATVVPALWIRGRCGDRRYVVVPVIGRFGGRPWANITSV